MNSWRICPEPRRRRWLPARSLLPLLLLGLLLAGCGPRPRAHASGTLYDGRVRRLALLPVTNLSPDPAAATVVDDALRLALAQRPAFALLPEQRVAEELAMLRIRYADRMSRRQVVELGKALQADVAFVCVIEDYGLQRIDEEDVPLVSIHARLIDLSDGRILWIGAHQRTGNDRESILGWGRVHSLPRLAQLTVTELLNTLPATGGS